MVMTVSNVVPWVAVSAGVLALLITLFAIMANRWRAKTDRQVILKTADGEESFTVTPDQAAAIRGILGKQTGARQNPGGL